MSRSSFELEKVRWTLDHKPLERREAVMSQSGNEYAAADINSNLARNLCELKILRQ